MFLAINEASDSRSYDSHEIRIRVSQHVPICRFCIHVPICCFCSICFLFIHKTSLNLTDLYLKKCFIFLSKNKDFTTVLLPDSVYQEMKVKLFQMLLNKEADRILLHSPLNI